MCRTRTPLAMCGISYFICLSIEPHYLYFTVSCKWSLPIFFPLRPHTAAAGGGRIRDHLGVWLDWLALDREIPLTTISHQKAPYYGPELHVLCSGKATVWEINGPFSIEIGNLAPTWMWQMMCFFLARLAWNFWVKFFSKDSTSCVCNLDDFRMRFKHIFTLLFSLMALNVSIFF